MKRYFEIGLALLVIVICLTTFLGCNYKAHLECAVNLNGEEILNKDYVENIENRKLIEKIFYTKRSKIVAEYRSDGMGDKEILENLFPDMVKDIEALAQKYSVLAKEPEIQFLPTDKTRFKFIEGENGKLIDTAKIYAKIIDNIDNKKINIDADFKDTKPQNTIENLKTKATLRSTFSTYYGSSSAARKNNINLALSFINGTILKPDEEFSFNNIVGKRSVSRGFQESIIIKGGKFVKGVGGGVCQVSTTLYNTVIRSDLEVVFASRHSLPVSYVPPSFDAMVSSVSDFKFKNNTNENIYIATSWDNQNIKIFIYGIPMDYDIKTVSEVVKTIPYQTEYVDDNSLPKGTEDVIKNGIDGIESKGYLQYIENGKVVSKRLIRHDVYAPQNKIVNRGTKETLNNENTA